MAEFRELYSMPEFYDVVFRRPVEREVDFMTTIFERANGRLPRSVLEVACGPAYHAREFARRGIRASGFDLEPRMIDFAAKQPGARDGASSFFVADMREFQTAEPVDLAFSMLDGIDSLVTTEELLAHFGCVAKSLAPGGLYLLDNMHPRDVSMLSYEPVVYEGGREGIRIRVVYGVEPPLIDLQLQTATAKTLVRIEAGDDTQILESTAVERFMTVQEVSALAKCSGALEILGTWGDFDVDVPFTMDQAATRMIIVLRRREI
jgi:SAM-dependent methyltransferase